MKRFLIVSFSLAVFALLVRWLAPVIIQDQLAKQLAKQDVELECLNWQIAGFQQLNIEQLCVSYNGIEAELQSVDVALMQAAFWQNNFDWKNLVPAIEAQKLVIVLPEQLDLTTATNSSTNDTPSGIPHFWLPDIAIEHIEIYSLSIEKVMAFSLNLSQEKQQRILLLKSVDVAENAWLSVSQRQQEFQIEWQIDLPWLYDNVLPWISILSPVPEVLKAVSVSSGVITSELKLDANKPKQFLSKHQLEELGVKLNHQALSNPLSVLINQQFELDRQGDELKFSLSRDGQNTLSDISGIANSILANYQWRGVQAAMPAGNASDLGLPARAKILLNENTQSIEAIELNALSISNSNQSIKLNDISWKADSQEIATSFRANNQIILTNTSQSTTLSSEFKGDIRVDAQSGFIGFRHYSVSGLPGNVKLVPELPEDISWQDILLTGSGIVDWQPNGLFITAENQVTLTELTTGPVSFDEISSTGEFELINQTLSSTQSVVLAPDLELKFSADGTTDALKIFAELPTTHLGKVQHIAQQLEPRVSLSDGNIAATITSTFKEFELDSASLNLDIDGASGGWQDYQFSGLNTAIPLDLNKALDITAQPKQLQIETLKVGTTVSNVDSRFLISGNLLAPQFRLEQLNGEIFRGSFSLEQLHYPLALNSEALLRIEQFNLNEMVNLFGDQGIEITGSVSGDIPLSFSEGLVSVEQAIVKADTDGLLSIQNNVAFQDLKESQGSLGIALTLLEELNYTKLQTEVHLEQNGWMTLAVNITGVNPQQEQPINFNPTLTTNLFTGLKALRAGQNVADTIEQQLQR